MYLLDSEDPKLRTHYTSSGRKNFKIRRVKLKTAGEHLGRGRMFPFKPPAHVDPNANKRRLFYNCLLYQNMLEVELQYLSYFKRICTLPLALRLWVGPISKGMGHKLAKRV